MQINDAAVSKATVVEQINETAATRSFSWIRRVCNRVAGQRGVDHQDEETDADVSTLVFLRGVARIRKLRS